MLIYIQSVSLILFSQHSSQRSHLPPWSWRNHSLFLMVTALEHGALILVGSSAPRPGVLCEVRLVEGMLAFASTRLVREHFPLAGWNLTRADNVTCYLSAHYHFWNLNCQNPFWLLPSVWAASDQAGWTASCGLFPTHRSSMWASFLVDSAPSFWLAHLTWLAEGQPCSPISSYRLDWLTLREQLPFYATKTYIKLPQLIPTNRRTSNVKWKGCRVLIPFLPDNNWAWSPPSPASFKLCSLIAFCQRIDRVGQK